MFWEAFGSGVVSLFSGEVITTPPDSKDILKVVIPVSVSAQGVNAVSTYEYE